MSRSRRKTPIRGVTTSDSEKFDKRVANRAERRAVKTAVVSTSGFDVLPAKRERSNVWAMAKDGKIFFDATKHPKLLRK
jgi:hypothetical protein